MITTSLLRFVGIGLITLHTCVTTAAAQSSTVQNQSNPPNQKTESKSLAETLDNLGRVYKNDQNEVLQELWLLGRYHGQYHWTEASTGEDHAYETRRFRLGTQAKLFKKMTVHAQMVSGSNIDPFYNGFTEL